jgi:ribosome-associated protein
MANHNTTSSLPAVEPVPEQSKPAKRARAMRIAQDDVPQYATERREPRRAAVAMERACACARIAEDNRGKEILLLDLRKSTPLVDFFVIATASSRRQSHAMASEIDAAMKKLGEAKLGLEGSEEGRWTLIDYGDFVVHIFSPEDRAYYALEDIWGDAPQLDWQTQEP